MTAVDDRPDITGDDDGARERQTALRGTYRSLQDMEARQRAILGELANIDKIDDPGPDDAAWQGTLITEHDDLDVLADPLRKRAKDLERVRAAHADPANREGPDHTTPDLATRNVIGQDPFRDLDRVRSRLVDLPEVRGRALDAIEMNARAGWIAHDKAENVTALAQAQYGQYGEGSRIAQHILETGSDAYRTQFEAYLRNPQREATRAALSLTPGSAGGFLLPFVLDPSIILTNASSANPWRRISRVVQTTSNTWNGVNSAGVTAGMIGEGSPFPDATPTVGNVVITPQKANAYIFGSYEVLEDTDFGTQLPTLLSDAKDRLEESQFATGNNTPPNTQGVVSAATTVVTTATTLVIAVGDVYNVHAALPPRFRNAARCAWVANVAIINAFRQLDTAGGSSFWTNLGKGQPETLLGAPIYESTTMSGTKAIGSLEVIFGSFNEYIICDRVGVSMIYEPMVKDTTTGRPTGQAAWAMFWRFGAQVSTANAFRVMKGL